FNGPIALSVDGLPPGVTCPPQSIGPGQRAATLVVSAAPSAAPFTGEVKIKGTATIKGQPAVPEAPPGSITFPVPPQQHTPAGGHPDQCRRSCAPSSRPVLPSAKRRRGTGPPTTTRLPSFRPTRRPST